jgi:hypothetical protein
MKKILILTITAFLSNLIYANPTPKPNATNKVVYEIKRMGIYHPGTGGSTTGVICDPSTTQVCVLLRKEVPDVWNPLNITYAEYYNPDTETWVSISGFTRTYLPGGVINILFNYGPTWLGPFGFSPSEYTVTVAP